MGSPFSSADKRLVAIVLGTIALSSFFVWFNYDAAFPQASLHLPLSRDEVTTHAADFLRSQGLDTSGFRNLTLFDPDEEGRLYLERELGLSEANRLMEQEVPVWRWRARWFRPPDKEEMIAHLRPDGSLIAFAHRIKETDSGPRLEPAEARAIADRFLRSQTAKPQKLISEQREARPNRDDHVFTWEQEGFKAKDATLRRTVTVQGGKVGAYQEFLYVPEQWQRDFAALRAANELYAGIAQWLFVVLIVVAVALLVMGLRKHEIAWRPLTLIAAAVAFFYFLNELNTLPFTVDSMPASSTLIEMQLMAFLQSVGSAVGVFIYVLTPAAAGAMWYARMNRPHPPLEIAFTKTCAGTRPFFRACLAGLGFAGGHLAFLTAFYLAGAKFGVWSPQEVDYSDMLATPIPWVYPIAIAMMAASAEEFWFRLLAIPVMARFIKIRWIVIAVPAIVWGFLHANYPQQPGYIRGVEVGMIGIAAGYLMLHFGIVATLVWHYTIDAFLIGMFLFKAEHWTYRLSGTILAVAILAPLLFSLVLYRRNGGFGAEPEAAGEPEAESAPVAATEEPLLDALPAPWPEKYLWAGAAVVVVLALLVKPVVFGGFLKVSIGRGEAMRLAEAELRKRGQNPADWRVAADFAANMRQQDFEYLREQEGALKANEIFRDRMAYGIWRVRYFKPLTPEELLFYVDQKGSVYRFDHVLDEKASGAQLERDAAESKAREFLEKRGIQGYSLADSQEEKLDHRTDHTFVWEDPAFRSGEARFRVAVQLTGDEVCEYRRIFKLPEQWIRDYQKPRIASYAGPAFFGATAVPLVLLFMRRLAAHGQRFHWKTYTLMALAALAVGLVERANGWPSLLSGYDTSTPLANFYGQAGTAFLTRLIVLAAAVFLGALATDLFVQLASSGRRWHVLSWPRVICVAGIAGASAQIVDWFLQQMPGARTSLPLSSIPGMDSFLPGLDAFAGNLITALTVVAVAAAYVFGGMRLLSIRSLPWALGAVVLAGAASQTMEFIQLPFTLAAAGFLMAMISLVVMTCGTDVVSAGAGLFLVLCASESWAMIAQPLSELKWNGALLATLSVVTILGIRAWQRRAA